MGGKGGQIFSYTLPVPDITENIRIHGQIRIFTGNMQTAAGHNRQQAYRFQGNCFSSCIRSRNYNAFCILPELYIQGYRTFTFQKRMLPVSDFYITPGIQCRFPGPHAGAQLSFGKYIIQLFHIFQVYCNGLPVILHQRGQGIQNNLNFIFFFCFQMIYFLTEFGNRCRFNKESSPGGGSIHYRTREFIFIFLFYRKGIMAVSVGNKAFGKVTFRAAQHGIQFCPYLLFRLVFSLPYASQGFAGIIIHPSPTDAAFNFVLKMGKILKTGRKARQSRRKLSASLQISHKAYGHNCKLTDFLQLIRIEQDARLCLLYCFPYALGF